MSNQGGIVYILQSQVTKKYYIGSTINLERRLNDHKRGNTKTTRINKPWFLIYSENYNILSEAKRREKQLKKWKSHKRISELIERSISNIAST